MQALIKGGEAGHYSDDNDLYLMAPQKGAPYWMLRYTLSGKCREITLGKHAPLSLAEARARAQDHQKLVQDGVDPIEARKQEQQVSISTVDDLFADRYPGLEKSLKHPGNPYRVYHKELSQSGRPTIGNDTLMYLKQLI